MIYTKPEVSNLGDAARVIQVFLKCVPQDIEAADPFLLGHPAYDLDE